MSHMRLGHHRRTTFKSMGGYRHGKGLVSSHRAIKSAVKGKRRKLW